MSASMSAVQEYAEACYAYLSARPMLVVSLVLMAYRVYAALFEKMPEAEGRVKEVASAEELDAAMESAKKAKKQVVVDFYATWCGPCKRVAPMFGAMSEEAELADVEFLRVDVDKAAGAAKKHGVTAMPTFVVVNASGKASTVVGADLAKVRRALAEGAKAE